MNETYYIPTNFTDAGRVMGLFEIRNMVEAILLAGPMLYLCLTLLPLALTPKIYGDRYAAGRLRPAGRQ